MPSRLVQRQQPVLIALSASCKCDISGSIGTCQAWMHCVAAQVYKGYLHEVDPIAIKALKGEQDARLQASFLKEIDILRRSRHPHIVQ